MYQGWCIIYFPTSEKWLQGVISLRLCPLGCTTGRLGLGWTGGDRRAARHGLGVTSSHRPVTTWPGAAAACPAMSARPDAMPRS